MTIGQSDGAQRELEELLQKRVAAFAGLFGAIGLVSVVTRTIAMIVWREELRMVPPATIPLQWVGALSLVAIWALTRAGHRSARFVRTVETAGLMITSLSFSTIALLMTLEVTRDPAVQALVAHPESGVFGVLAMTVPLIGVNMVLVYAVVLRAAFVPTDIGHTALLTAALGVPMLAVAWIAGAGAAPGLPFITPYAFATIALVSWGVAVLVCSAISHVIYGLRQEVREMRRLGQYTLTELIGEGGMGSVYRARHEMLRRPTAVKLLSPDRSGDEAIERFEREVQLTAELTHPNTVTIYDYGRTADGVLYYAMELLEGATLQEVVEIDGPQPAARVARILHQVAGALGEAHSIGLIHRDIKPANIVLCEQGGEFDVAKVVDFGLVKELEERGAVMVSQDGSISGTPLYMAPEILRKRNNESPSSDLYALGAVGYYLLTGTHVFDGHTVIEVLSHHLHTDPEPPSVRLGDEVPRDLERLVLELLSKDPAARPPDATELRARLEACAELGTWTQNSARMWWAAHGPGLVARRTAPPVAPKRGQSTLAVDLVRRGASRVESAR